jgi:hypothetical protein
MSPDGETDVVPSKPKRAPRKRVPKVVSDDAGTPAAVRRAPRKRVTKEEEVTASVRETRTATRRAPTPIADEYERAKKARKQAAIVATMLIVGVGASAIVGYTDKGQIDVSGTIAWRNEQARSVGNEGAIIPVQNTSQLPDGGLITAPDGQELVPSPPTQSDSTAPTASSTPTEVSASSTEVVASTTTPQ